MSQGLQVFNASGQVIFNTSDRLTRIIGSASLSGNGSMVVPEFATGAGFYFMFALEEYAPGVPRQFPRITISGTTLSWDTPGTPHVPGLVFYGVY